MKNRKKAKFKKRYWLLIDLAVVIVIFTLLLYKPGRYNPPDAASDNQVSPYLTHELLPQLYNGAQHQEPFNLIVTQKGINDIVRRAKWPRQSEDTTFSAPEVFFETDSIMLMGTVALKGAELVVTIVVEPHFDHNSLLNLQLAKVKIGAVNITPLARILARRMYHQQLMTVPIDTEDIRAQIAASLLNDEPFEPVFKIEDKKLRVKKITIAREKLTIRLEPVFE